MPKDTFRIAFDGREYQFQEGENLLSSLLESNVLIPHSCLAGVCRSCQLELLNRQTHILACQTIVSEDMALRLATPNTIESSIHDYQTDAIGPNWLKLSINTLQAPFPFQSITWKDGHQSGQSFILSSLHGYVSFLLPALENTVPPSFSISWKLQRQQQRFEGSVLILMESHFEDIKNEVRSNLDVVCSNKVVECAVIEAGRLEADLRFKRFDLAICVHGANPLKMGEIEMWLQNNYCRVGELQFLALY